MKIIIEINPTTKKATIDANEVTGEHLPIFCKILLESYLGATNMLFKVHKCDDPKCEVTLYNREIVSAIISTTNLYELRTKK